MFLAANHNGTTLVEQLIEAGVQVGWGTRIACFGPDISSAVFALGFANRVAMAFGGVEPGDYKKILMYNKERVFAFVNALGDVGTEWGVAAAGCVNWGFPTIADTDITQILPSGICTYEHVVAPVAHDEICARSVEVRGLKTLVSDIEIPCAFGPAYEGERVRGADLHAQMRRRQEPVHRTVKMAEMNDIEDGKVEVVGPDITEVKEGGTFPPGNLCPDGRPRVPDGFRADPRTPDPSPGQLHSGGSCTSVSGISPGFALGKAAIEKGLYPQRHRGCSACQVSPGFRKHPRQGPDHPVHQQKRCG